MPQNRHLKYVLHDSEFMQAAKKAQEECAGDSLFPVGIVLVRDGMVVARAGNGYNKGPGKPHVCPRVVLECPSGTGYDLCSLHGSPGHAEPMLMKVAKEQGIDVEGADVYMYGHWWACEPCWKVLIDSGVRDLYVAEDAHERFSRDVVYAKTLKSNLSSAYIAGVITNVPSDEFEDQKKLYEAFADVCEGLNIKACVPHLHNGENQKIQKDPRQVYEWSVGNVRNLEVTIAEVSYPSLGTGGEIEMASHHGRPVVLLSRKGRRVSSYTIGHPAVVYHVEYEDREDACRKLRNVLKQL